MLNQRRSKGITLISLVITIIILVILAGVTIGILVNGSTLFERASEAVDKTKMEAAREKVILAILAYRTDEANTTLYNQLKQIHGLSKITPDDETGPGYEVVVDGYLFEIDIELNVIEKGKAQGEVAPSLEVEVNGEQIKVKAKTTDSQGLEKIELVYVQSKENGTENEVIDKLVELNGEREKEEVFTIVTNGTYRIRGYGKNGKISEVKEIEITSIAEEVTKATIVAGSMVNASVNLNIETKTSQRGIEKIEVYEDSTIIHTYSYETLSKEVKETYTVENVPFYETKQYYIKVTDSKGETESNKASVQNYTDIKTATDLTKFRTLVNGGNTFSGKQVKQVENITLSGSWTPIGTSSYIFSGTYNGNGKTISGLSISSAGTKLGLFSNNQGTIKDLGVVNSTITRNTPTATEDVYVGMIAGTNEGTIQNCYNTGSVTLTLKNTTTSMWLAVGGIVGYNEQGTIKDCYNNGSIAITAEYIGGYSVGGINGGTKSSITSCENKENGTITVNSIGNVQVSHVGGISGSASPIGSLVNCQNKALVSTTRKSLNSLNHSGIGGIIGYTEGKTESCVNEGKVLEVITDSTIGDTIGGIAGTAKNDLINCTNKGFVDVQASITNQWNAIGGIVGYANTKINIQSCINLGDVSAQESYVNGSYVGGIVGCVWDENASTIATINKCANEGNILSKTLSLSTNSEYNCIVGGIVGSTQPNLTITQSYNKGKIQGIATASQIKEKNIYSGGIAGHAVGYTTIANSYNTGDIYDSKGNIHVYLHSGGIVGDASAITIQNCYTTGIVYTDGSYNQTWQGLGFVSGWSVQSISNSYYLTPQTTGGNYASSSIGGSSATGISGVSSSALRTLYTTLGTAYWQKDTANKNNGYPILSWE